MSDEEDFEEQIRQEKLAESSQDAGLLEHGRTRKDEDGTEYEWDADKQAWFPKIDQDFIAQYQMNYGNYKADTPTTTPAATASEAPETAAANSAATPSSEDIPPPPTTDVNDPSYYEWYYKYYGHLYYSASLDTETNTTWSSAVSGDTYQHDMSYYNELNMEPGSSAGQENGNKKNKKDKGPLKPGDKRKPEATWFEVDEDNNTNIYVSGLPKDITDEEFEELMKKCGLVMYDPRTRGPKLKLYRDEDGQPKGDGRCCYIKVESVQLALQMVDGSELRGNTIKVERAKFELKGQFDPKRRKKLTNKEKNRMRKNHEKLFDWRPDMPTGSRAKSDKTVVLKHCFHPDEFEKDPMMINEIRQDLREGASKYGEVKKIVICDRNQEGVALISFREPEEADKCKEALNGRWFAQRQLVAETWDGKTKYEVEETEEDRAARLKKWGEYLEAGGEEGASKTETKTADTTQEQIDTVHVKKVNDPQIHEEMDQTDSKDTGEKSSEEVHKTEKEEDEKESDDISSDSMKNKGES